MKPHLDTIPKGGGEEQEPMDAAAAHEFNRHGSAEE